jgi:hypothetical protein
VDGGNNLLTCLATQSMPMMDCTPPKSFETTTKQQQEQGFVTTGNK